MSLTRTAGFAQRFPIRPRTRRVCVPTRGWNEGTDLARTILSGSLSSRVFLGYSPRAGVSAQQGAPRPAVVTGPQGALADPDQTPTFSQLLKRYCDLLFLQRLLLLRRRWGTRPRSATLLDCTPKPSSLEPAFVRAEGSIPTALSSCHGVPPASGQALRGLARLRFCKR